ncbi:NADH-quinone oxidoreductase subunit M [Methylomagnum ishizawai]|uniref:NADH-quinone oxidoreductase subunit M n=1 Tax=Methylomagnum ishizawai TaxID=1760988 RepID=A0A1Y6CV39_9GAMM|nr:NADH-quinone oxidoreductase subunit M [Methylomagnum ishizawai]SMF94498.1 NADH-quinone oxidoreductase subunit M [Methylomagnum ishizawai]
MHPAGFPYLSLLVLLPLAAAVPLLFGCREARTARRYALAVAGVELALSLGLFAAFDGTVTGMQFIERHPWIPSLNLEYALGLDGLSLPFPALTALLTLAVMVASWTAVLTQVRLYLALLLLLESATLGVFCAIDLGLFFLCWELTLVPIFFLISLWGIGPERRHAALKYTLFMLGGGIPLLFGILLLAFEHGQQMGLPLPGGLSFDYPTLLKLAPAEEPRTAVFLLLLLGFAVKAPLVPFHTWLPTVAMEGPAGLAALLTGLKLGLFGMLRYALPLVPEAAQHHAWLLSFLGSVGVVYGALLALRQTNLRRLLAYSSISHAGLVVIGLATLNPQGVQGALFQLINFPLISGGLFLLAGCLHQRLGSTDLIHVGGTARTLPRWAGFLFLFGLATMGVPGTNGFAAEHLIVIGAFIAHPGSGFAALLGAVLGAAYCLGFYRRAGFGPVSADAGRSGLDLRPRETLLMAILAGLALWLGLAPGVVLDASRASVQAWVYHVNQVEDAPAYADTLNSPTRYLVP